MNRIINGDVLRFAAHYRGERFHGVLCDPPYELGFMGKSWDSRGVSFRAETWSAIRSLLLPGAHLLAFGGTRTFHRIAVAIEDAGFEIRDTIGWLYGSGFPKSHDVSKAIDREAGAEREKIKVKPRPETSGTMAAHGDSRPWINKSRELGYHEVAGNIPATDSAREWQGYGTALKPAWEPVIVARNPLAGTVAQNAIEHGAGALNVDGGRVGDELITSYPGLNRNKLLNDDGWSGIGKQIPPHSYIGRWPANILHDGSDDIAEIMGDAQRFFYCAKAGKKERNDGVVANHHPTVKPLALTEYLAKIIVPPAHVESRLLVPFAGSGSECIGAIRAGWRHVVGVEQNDEYARIARARIEHHSG